MKKTASMYVLFFLANSLAYVLVDTFKGKLVHNDTLSEELYVSFVVVAVLSVISLLTERVGTTVMSHLKRAPKVRFMTVLILIAIVSILVDLYLLLIMTDLIGKLHANLLDRFLLAGLCQIVPIELLRDPKKI